MACRVPGPGRVRFPGWCQGGRKPGEDVRASTPTPCASIWTHWSPRAISSGSSNSPQALAGLAPSTRLSRGWTAEAPEDRLLAQILLSHLASTGSDNAHKAAIEAGRAWGRFLIDPVPPFHRPTAEESAIRLTALLDDLGFSSTPEGGGDGGAPEQIRLRHCPFLELAQEHGQLVCSVHLGLIQGALAELRAPMAADRLEPFAEPDSCLAHLAPSPPADSVAP